MLLCQGGGGGRGKQSKDNSGAAKVAEARRRFAEMERGQCDRIREVARKEYEEWLRLDAGKAPSWAATGDRSFGCGARR